MQLPRPLSPQGTGWHRAVTGQSSRSNPAPVSDGQEHIPGKGQLKERPFYHRDQGKPVCVIVAVREGQSLRRVEDAGSSVTEITMRGNDPPGGRSFLSCRGPHCSSVAVGSQGKVKQSWELNFLRA